MENHQSPFWSVCHNFLQRIKYHLNAEEDRESVINNIQNAAGEIVGFDENKKICRQATR